MEATQPREAVPGERMPRPHPQGTIPSKYGTIEQQRHATLARLREERDQARTEVKKLKAAIAEHQALIQEPRMADMKLWELK